MHIWVCKGGGREQITLTELLLAVLVALVAYNRKHLLQQLVLTLKN